MTTKLIKQFFNKCKDSQKHIEAKLDNLDGLLFFIVNNFYADSQRFV